MEIDKNFKYMVYIEEVIILGVDDRIEKRMRKNKVKNYFEIKFLCLEYIYLVFLIYVIYINVDDW